MPSWDPFGEIERLRREVDRVFGGLAGDASRSLTFLPGIAARQHPHLNVTEIGDEYLVEALAPGVDPSTLDVSVQGNRLTVSGEKKPPEGVSPEAFHRSERSAGRFVRTVDLPADVDPNKVKAGYADGVLQVRLPKAETAKPKRIEIAVG
jgi:HSP20 family protein